MVVCYVQLLANHSMYIVCSKKKKVLRFAQYVKLPIDAFQVYIIFEWSEYYLIHPAKEIFRKFPKMVILEFILILPQVFY